MWIWAQTSQNLREWARDVLLRVVENESHAEMEMHLSSLSLSVSRCLMNALDPLLQGEKDDPGTTRRPLPPSPDNEGRASARTPSKAHSEQGEMTR
jgi:hypothetical protein